MKNFKKAVAGQLEDLTDLILTATGCKHVWGEPELPECVRKDLEAHEMEN